MVSNEEWIRMDTEEVNNGEGMSKKGDSYKRVPYKKYEGNQYYDDISNCY